MNTTLLATRMAKKTDKEASSTIDKVSAPPGIKMKAFSTSNDVEETGRLWSKCSGKASPTIYSAMLIF